MNNKFYISTSISLKKALVTLAGIISLSTTCLAQTTDESIDKFSSSANTLLWYDQPAKNWMTEALPLGNGSLGGMVFGLTTTERVQFNHNTLWTGNEKDTGYYQAFGDVFIQIGHADPTNYRRELDIDQALLKVSYNYNGIRYNRRAFASHPAKTLVYHFDADKSGAYTGRIWLSDAHDAIISGDGTRLTASGRLGRDGLNYESQLNVIANGGRIRLETKSLDADDMPLDRIPGAEKIKLSETCLVFEGCNSITLVLAADTDYLADSARQWRRPLKSNDILQRVTAIVDSATLNSAFAAHRTDYQSLFHRFKLDLGNTPSPVSAKPTNERILAYTKQNAYDPDLEELFTQYGRYLMISCSRPGGLPANLQGLWNDSNTPPWRSDYHSNINVQMNYWPVESTNLAELHRPFIDYVLSQIPVYRLRTRENADFASTLRGWTVRTENGVFGGGSFLWNAPGSAWYCLHLWEHYAFSCDKKYLSEIAYPVIKEVCEFWEDILTVRPDGTLVAPKGWSPEHGPVEPGVSYDQQIIYNLFTNYIDAADALNIDKSYRDKIAALREKLLAPKIGKWGQLQEWETDRDDPKNIHRHVSHLFGLHPGRQITANGSAQLFEAAKVSLNARGDSGTGWSKAWKINFWARLQDGDRSYRLLRSLMTAVNTTGANFKNGGGIYPNLLDAHPPFQIDGNFGATAGVAEMLMQSHTGEIVLLPALPKAWSTGAVIGLRARGAITVDMKWESGRIQYALLKNMLNQENTVNVRYGSESFKLILKPHESQTLPLLK